jgi:alpha-1,6-mannosyltransferase
MPNDTSLPIVPTVSSRKALIFLAVSGIGLLATQLLLSRLSSEFVYGRPFVERPIATLVLIKVAAGALFLAAVWAARSMTGGKAAFAWVMVVGLLLRFTMVFSTPMLEDDFYRYFWDGAVVAHGFNPYTHSPGQVMEASSSVPEGLKQLAAESGHVISRVNHPNLRTIYPPLTQLVFASAYFLGPWSLVAWRLVLTCFDFITLILLLLILRDLRFSSLLIVVYWWNPIVIKEIFNAAHMDVLVIPFVLVAVYLASRGRETWGAGVMALAAAVKIWPVVLVPAILSPSWKNIRRLAISLSIFILTCTILYAPVFLSDLGQSSGFTAYGKEWEMNDALYMLVLWGVEYGLWAFSGDAGLKQIITRCIVAVLLMAWITWVCRKRPEQPVDYWDRSLLIVAGVFLLSPTQFPWYYVWMIPFLVIRPRYALLVLSALLPLYYLRFYFQARDQVTLFDNYLVWLEYLPVWIMLLREWAVTRRTLQCP